MTSWSASSPSPRRPQPTSHLAQLGLVDAAAAERYRALGAPQGAATAREWIRERIGEQALKIEYTAHNDAWDSMFEALVAYAADAGHCYPTDDVAVDGRSLGRWSRKQRGLQRQGRLRPDRAERLATLPTWSSGTAHEAGFWSRYRAYLQRAEATDPDERENAMPGREATVWANNLRSRREDLVAHGRDLPDDQLKALEGIPGWSWTPFGDSHTTKVQVMQQFVTTTGRPVASIKQREEWNGHPIGVWLNSWRTNRGRLPDAHKVDLEALAGWTWDQRGDQWEAMFQQLTDFGTDHGHLRPSLTLGSEQEKTLARWKRNQKNRLQGRDDARADELRTLLARYGEELP